MSKHIIPILLLMVLSGACKKDEIPLSGTVTIDNDLYGNGPYYSLGFSFATAQKVSSLQEGFDVVLTNDGTTANLILQANNFKNSFHLAGTYTDETAAKQAFSALTNPAPDSWAEWAFGIKPNQIWIYRSNSEKYAKIRIISIESLEKTPRDFASCTFEWVFQPDGTLNFPGK